MKKNINIFLKTAIIKMVSKNKVDHSTWIFSSSFNTKFNYNSKYLFEYVLSNESEITPLFVINDDSLRETLKNEYGEQFFIESYSFKGIKRILSAGVWFTSAGLPIYGFNLNKDRLIVNLWHGIPLKKIALLENGSSFFKNIYFKYIFSKNYTYILTTSNNLVEIMKSSMGVNKEKIKVWGQPRNDLIFKDNETKCVLEELYKQLPIYKKIILYAPTYRDSYKTELFPFNDFNLQQLNDFLNDNELIIFVRSHQSEIDNCSELNSKRIFFINEDIIEDIMEIINIFDLLITDYSSIYIDFLLTEKPIIFLPYDKDKYIENRGFNFQYDTVTPGPKPNSLKDFEEELLQLLSNHLYYQDERKEMNKFFNEIKESSSACIISEIKKEIKSINY